MKKILIIDDEEQMRRLLRNILEREGYEVAEAPDGKIGIRLHQKNPADLVITDLIMPEKEGIETIMELKRNFPDTKIFAMSGGGRYDPKTYLDIAKKLGANMVIQKPFDRQELVEAVREVLE